MPTEMELTLEQTQQGVSYEVSNIRVISFTMKMEILLEPTSNKLMVASAAAKPCQGDSLKLFLITGNIYTDQRGTMALLMIGVADSQRLKNLKKDATLKLFKSTNPERYEHVGPEVTRSQDGKVNKMAKRDYAWLIISRCSRSHLRQAKEQAQDLKSMITTSNHKLMIEVKRAQD
ncbi:hypothetical protein Tco_0880363 [Tanacetum coccineum]